ncbi:MAG TPA: hypothetical protein VES42_05590 [Pilimelia sp.]|nr:hypothetical protein [Pilimelia sp.]
MSQSWSRHRATLAAAAIIAGAPFLAAGAAQAESMESGRQVTFSGSRLLGVSCAANPSTRSVTVPAESTLKVVNRTGHRATLLLDGAARGEVAEGSTAQVLFRRGPVSLALKPHCVLAEKSAVEVRVVAARPAIDPAPPAPTGPTRPFGPTGGGETPPRATTPGGPGRAAGGSSAGGSAPVRPARPGAVNRSAADTPPGSRATPAAESPTLIGEPTSTPALPVDEVPADGSGTDLAAEPLGSVEPVSDKEPIGLLALIATVCVLGVSIGAIRAILAQRASRASFA